MLKMLHQNAKDAAHKMLTMLHTHKMLTMLHAQDANDAAHTRC